MVLPANTATPAQRQLIPLHPQPGDDPIPMDVYRAVLERAYGRMRTTEQALALDTLAPRSRDPLPHEFTFDYQQANPDFVHLVAIENINRAAYLRTLDAVLGYLGAQSMLQAGAAIEGDPKCP